MQYLGHINLESGLQKSKEKIEAILKVKKPKNVDDLRKFLGMVNYYNNFIPNLASKLHCLNNLFKKNTPFDWNDECEQTFEIIKKELSNENVLTMYDEALPLILATDASPFGISAILSNVTNNGECPIAYAFRTLTKAEQNYSHLDKEA